MRGQVERGRRRVTAGTSIARSLVLVVGLVSAAGSVAETALIAVAANFSEVVKQLEADFERQSPHDVTSTIGSTGKLYAQITLGAPFDVLLAADQVRPQRLETEGFAVEGSRFTYATGRVTLWSRDPALVPEDGAALLGSGDFARLAMANPDLAPYGEAARETLVALHVYDSLRDRIVLGENIGQTHAMVATGNAELGFVALSYVLSPRNDIRGSRWDVPQNLYTPIRQDAVLLSRAEDNSAARDFLAYLRRPEVRELIRSFGYSVD